MFSKRSKKYFFKKKSHKRFYNRSINRPMFDPQRLLYYSTRNQREGQVIRPKTYALEAKKPMIRTEDIKSYLDNIEETKQYKLISKDKNRSTFGRISYLTKTEVPALEFTDEGGKINFLTIYENTLYATPEFNKIKKTPYPFTIDNQHLTIQHIIPLTATYRASTYSYKFEVFLVNYLTVTELNDDSITNKLIYSHTFNIDWTQQPNDITGAIFPFNVNDIGMRLITPPAPSVPQIQLYIRGVPSFSQDFATGTVSNIKSIIYQEEEFVTIQEDFVPGIEPFYNDLINYLFSHSGVNPITNQSSDGMGPFVFFRFTDLLDSGFNDFIPIIRFTIESEDENYEAASEDTVLYIHSNGVITTVNARLNI